MLVSPLPLPPKHRKAFSGRKISRKRKEALGVNRNEWNLFLLLIELNCCTSIVHKYSSCAITLSFILLQQWSFSSLTERTELFYISANSWKTQLETHRIKKGRGEEWNLLFVFPLLLCKKLLHLQKKTYLQRKTEHKKSYLQNKFIKLISLFRSTSFKLFLSLKQTFKSNGNGKQRVYEKLNFES